MDSTMKEKTINRQIAIIMANYGDQPEKFMIKIYSLVMEWHSKGITDGANKNKDKGNHETNDERMESRKS